MHTETRQATERGLAGDLMRSSGAGVVQLTCDQTLVGIARTRQMRAVAQGTTAMECPLSSQSRHAEAWHKIARHPRSELGNQGGKRWPRLTGKRLSSRSPAVACRPFSRSHPFSQSRENEVSKRPRSGGTFDA